MTAPGAAVVDEAGPVADFRLRLRGFLSRHRPGRPPRDRAARLDWQRRWAALLVDEGWAGPSWPREWGGMDLPIDHQLAYHEEMAAARTPRHPSPNVGSVGPTLIRHGTEDQRRRFLLPMLRGDELWAQGFSEPDAGSDLPSLRTRAEQEGDDYVVTGEKVWSTQAEVCDWMFTLVRTGRPGRAGISYLLVDLSTPGISVEPLRDLTGRRDFCRVVLDGARVPVANRVGEEDGGWAIARTTLGHERSVASAARANGYRQVVAGLIELAGRTGAGRDPVLRQRLAGAEIDARLLALIGQRVLAVAAADGEPGPLSSVARLSFSEFEQRLHELGTDVVGAASLLHHSDPHAVERGRWTWGLLRTRASTIGAGTAEVQRNTIAERVLGLPRDPEARR